MVAQVGAADMPAAEVDVSVDLVRRLLGAQHPDLAQRPIEVLANGWDNLTCRLGEDLAVRLPRRAVAARLVAHEQRWLPGLAGRLPLPVPAPVRTGRPGPGYPWAWSVVPFLPGEIAAETPPADPDETADQLAGFLAALHRPAPDGHPVNPVRGVALAVRTAAVEDRLDQLGGLLDQPAVLDVWQRALAAPPYAGPPLWLHGDLHPANILVRRGRLSAVIDFGDITAGDPATDLAAVWMLLPRAAHDRFRAGYASADDATWARSRGWALVLALAFLAHSADNPLMARIGRRTIAALLADHS
jgi:aminoglycoside phosphotransferase (APT) family kinase protein